MDKKTIITLAVALIAILTAVIIAFSLEGNVKNMDSNTILVLNDVTYTKADFEKYLMYRIFQNDGKMPVDEQDEQVKAKLNQGYTVADIFKEDSLQEFYATKVYNLAASDKEVALTSEEANAIENTISTNKDKLSAYGLTNDEYKAMAQEETLREKLEYSAKDYLTLPEEVYNAFYETVSGEARKSYTYRILNVYYEDDKVSGEVPGVSSGEIIPGNKAEKEAYIKSLVEKVKGGASFESISDKGDARFTFTVNGIETLNGEREYAVGPIFHDLLANEDLYNASAKLNAGEMTEVIDTGIAFEVLYMENVEEGFVGEAKNQLVDLMVTQYAQELIYSYIKNMDVNTSALSRIIIK